jgi:hypothetical protein
MVDHKQGAPYHCGVQDVLTVKVWCEISQRMECSKGLLAMPTMAKHCTAILVLRRFC